MTIIKNKNCMLWLATLLILIPSAVSAGVYFIESKDSVGGYEQTRPCFVDHPLYGPCPAGKVPQILCPKDTRYYQRCECDSKYQYDTSNCTDNKTLGGGSCDGKYETCSCNTGIYRYKSSNCASPKVLGGRSCNPLVLGSGVATPGGLAAFASNSGMVNPGGSYPGGSQMQTTLLYETCTCPAEYNKTCSFPMIGGETAACDGKYKTCKCPSNYVTCNYGGAVGATKCTEESGTVKWSKCKPEACPAGTTDYSGMGSNLNLVVASSAIQNVGTKKCVPNNYCATLGYGKSCSGEAVKCPLDTSKLYCF